MRQVCRLDLQVAEDGQNLGHGHLTAHFQNVEQTWDVLLDVQLHAERLECHVFDPPHVRNAILRTVCAHLELRDALKEVVDVSHIVIEYLLGWILYGW